MGSICQPNQSEHSLLTSQCVHLPGLSCPLVWRLCRLNLCPLWWGSLSMRWINSISMCCHLPTSLCTALHRLNIIVEQLFLEVYFFCNQLIIYLWLSWLSRCGRENLEWEDVQWSQTGLWIAWKVQLANFQVHAL